MKLRILAATTAATMSSIVAERPIAKVIKLLTDMQKQMETEREDDDAVYKKYQCWCDKEEEDKLNISKKQKSIMDKQDAMAKNAFSQSEKLAAKRVKTYENLTTKTRDLEALRNKCMKEKGGFSTSDQELERSIIATKNAITILSKHNFLQGSNKVTNDIRQALHSVVSAPGIIARADAGDATGLVAISTLLEEAGGRSFLQQSPAFSSYGSSSGQIFGILNQMLEDLTRDQSEGAKAEKARIAACQEGDASLTQEISVMQDSLSNMDARLGELAQIESDSKEDYASAKEAYGNAVEFLGKLKTQCEQSAVDYTSRTKSRNDELVAIADTIDILNNDDSFQSFGKALGKSAPSKALTEEEFLETNFLQLSSNARRNDVINSELRRSAVDALQKYSTKSAQTYLVQYLIKSTAVDKGAIKKVQEKIDLLIGELKAKQTEEISIRDECIADFNRVKLDMQEKSRDKDNSDEEVESLTEEVASLSASIEESATDTKKLKAAAAEGSETRKQEAAEYQTVVKDHQAVQEILQKAIDRMNAVYSDMKVEYALNQKEQPGADFVKVENTDTAPGSGPAAFTGDGATKRNKGGNKVVAMLKEVLNDSVKTEKDATTAENDAQAAYESFMAETDRALAMNDKSIAQKLKRSGQAEGLKSDEEETITSLSKGLYDLTEENDAIHGRCDFVMNNFEARQTARNNEMSALAQAKQLLGGMST